MEYKIDRVENGWKVRITNNHGLNPKEYVFQYGWDLIQLITDKEGLNVGNTNTSQSTISEPSLQVSDDSWQVDPSKITEVQTMDRTGRERTYEL